jgi:nitrogen regulatory protein P-II 1
MSEESLAQETEQVPPMQLVVTIVDRGYSSSVIAAARRAGAEGGTVMSGRGTGIHEKKKLLGIPIQPEKDIVFTLAPVRIIDAVVKAIVAECSLDQPATGICFVLPVDQVHGINHHFE